MSTVTTPMFRVSYPQVFEAKLNELSKKAEYSVVALFPKGTDLSGLEKAAKEAMVKRWGVDPKKWPKNRRSPFRDQVEREKENDEGLKYLPDGHEAGAIFMNLKTKNRPGLVNASCKPILDETEFYAGCYARAAVVAYAYDAAGNAGVAFGLQHIQKLKDGEPFSGRVSLEQAFSPLEMEDSQTAETDMDALFG